MKSRQVDANTFVLEAQTTQELRDIKTLIASNPEIPPEPQLPVEGEAIPTFHSIGLYWDPPLSLGKNAGVPVRYRENAMGAEWVRAFDIHYDARPLTDPFTGKSEKKARGSLVHLKSNTEYIVQFGVRDSSSGEVQWQAQLSARTWDDNFKIARGIKVESSATMLRCVEGGSEELGYVLYEGPAAVDVKKQFEAAIRIEKSFVIVRGITCRGGSSYGIVLAPGVHDVVIEYCDISDWGKKRGSGKLGEYGVNMQSAIHFLNNLNGREREYKRVVIQRNKIHDPTYGTNDWTEGHPTGPQAISSSNTGGNHVIRYNSIYASEVDPRKINKWMNDSMGGGSNASNRGWPGPDTDIYQNAISCFMDDGIEAEGGGRNVRIWGNKIERGGMSAIATNVVHQGPTYVWRNVTNGGVANPSSNSGLMGFMKTGDRGGYGGGRKFIFHNSVLKPCSYAISDVSDIVNGCYVRNNVWLMNGNRGTYAVEGSDNSMNYDMSSSTSWGTMPANQERQGLPGKTAVYKVDSIELVEGSPGKGAAQIIAGFNSGEKPDMGAFAGQIMTFGVDA